MQLNFNHVDKNYGTISALKDIDFEIKSGEFLFIVGPSGAGKSTLLKLILRQIKPSSGEIIIGGIDMSNATRHDVESVRKSIGLIFQDSQLIVDKSVEENIALALDIVDYPRDQIPQKIDEVLSKVGLTTRKFLYPSQLSGGEMQRAALARALAINPKLILADEPTGNLDPENSWNILKLLKNINESLGTTIIMTTHNPDFIDSLDKRTIYLRQGKIERDESSEEKNINLHTKKHKKHE